MSSASSALDSATTLSKIVRTADGAYIQTAAGVVTDIAPTDAFLSCPIGTVLLKNGSADFTATVPGMGNIAPVRDTPKSVAPISTTGITTVAAFLAGLTSFNTSFRT